MRMLPLRLMLQLLLLRQTLPLVLLLQLLQLLLLLLLRLHIPLQGLLLLVLIVAPLQQPQADVTASSVAAAVTGPAAAITFAALHALLDAQQPNQSRSELERMICQFFVVYRRGC
eukprot:GHVQ01029089.1.p1 GENE.GHVQ01029089.1~~GHVQ01029089.1.p1  ORF type:complete len:115 (-),score=29.70 GHVQ01029089.1:11-355(-)